MSADASEPTRCVYLAGPTVFLPDARAVGRRLVEACRASGLEGLFPLDKEIAPAEPALMAAAIYRANLQMIDRADGVLADIGPFRGAGMDPGTAFEIGYAIAQEKAGCLLQRRSQALSGPRARPRPRRPAGRVGSLARRPGPQRRGFWACRKPDDRRARPGDPRLVRGGLGGDGGPAGGVGVGPAPRRPQPRERHLPAVARRGERLLNDRHGHHRVGEATGHAALAAHRRQEVAGGVAGSTGRPPACSCTSPRPLHQRSSQPSGYFSGRRSSIRPASRRRSGSRPSHASLPRCRSCGIRGRRTASSMKPPWSCGRGGAVAHAAAQRGRARGRAARGQVGHVARPAGIGTAAAERGIEEPAGAARSRAGRSARSAPRPIAAGRSSAALRSQAAAVEAAIEGDAR